MVRLPSVLFQSSTLPACPFVSCGSGGVLGNKAVSSVDPAIEADKMPTSTLSRMAKLCSAFERWPLIIESRGPEHSAIRAAWTYNGVLDDEGDVSRRNTADIVSESESESWYLGCVLFRS